MGRRKKTTDWPEGFEAYIRGRQFTDMEELLLWDCSVMHCCFKDALANWETMEGAIHEDEMLAAEWKAVRAIANEISMQRWGRPLSMDAVRWGCALAKRVEGNFLEQLIFVESQTR